MHSHAMVISGQKIITEVTAHTRTLEYVMVETHYKGVHIVNGIQFDLLKLKCYLRDF